MDLREWGYNSETFLLSNPVRISLSWLVQHFLIPLCLLVLLRGVQVAGEMPSFADGVRRLHQTHQASKQARELAGRNQGNCSNVLRNCIFTPDAQESPKPEAKSKVGSGRIRMASRPTVLTEGLDRPHGPICVHTWLEYEWPPCSSEYQVIVPTIS